jgi:hypothetical protein
VNIDIYVKPMLTEIDKSRAIVEEIHLTADIIIPKTELFTNFLITISQAMVETCSNQIFESPIDEVEKNLVNYSGYPIDYRIFSIYQVQNM